MYLSFRSLSPSFFSEFFSEKSGVEESATKLHTTVRLSVQIQRNSSADVVHRNSGENVLEANMQSKLLLKQKAKIENNKSEFAAKMDSHICLN